MQGHAHIVNGMHGPVRREIINAEMIDLKKLVVGLLIRSICRHSYATTFLFLSALGTGSLRNRGLATSSMPKLMRASPAPNTAIQRPGGTNHHQRTSTRAFAFCAQ